jgi:hypothetical protein
MSETMFEAMTLISNVYGLNVNRFSETITKKDLNDLKIISKPPTKKSKACI